MLRYSDGEVLDRNVERYLQTTRAKNTFRRRLYD